MRTVSYENKLAKFDIHFLAAKYRLDISKGIIDFYYGTFKQANYLYSNKLAVHLAVPNAPFNGLLSNCGTYEPIAT